MQNYIRFYKTKNLFIKNLIIIFLLTAGPALCQLNSSGNLKTYVDNIITNMPAAFNNNDYRAPAEPQLEVWERTVTDIINAQYSSAHNRADSIGYEVMHYTDTEPNPDKDYYILQKKADSLNYWGTYIFNQAPDRLRLIIQSPHPKFDFNTGKQGFIIFKNLGARVFCLSGTHRCNSSSLSTCDGVTAVCSGSDESYRISDQAHNVNSLFQKTVTTISALIANIIVVQPHGFTKDVGDPDLIMSSGSRYTPSTDYLSALKTELLLLDADLTFKIAHIDTTWDKLNALTNTQGRFINGSIDPCDDNAPANTGRFLHIEQAKDSLRDTETNLLKLSNALANIFPVELLPAQLESFIATAFNNGIILKWQTITETNNYGFEVQRLQDYKIEKLKEWMTVGFVKGSGNSNSQKKYSFIDKDVIEGKYQYRLKQIDNDSKFEYSKTVEASFMKPDEFALEQNYPNPFNPTTNIEFRISDFGLVTLKVYDILGNEVATLVNQELSRGDYHFPISIYSGAADGHFPLASGVYYYTLTSGALTTSKKFMIMK